MASPRAKFTVSFPAEIKQVSCKKLASLDKQYMVTLITDDQTAMLLDNFASDILVDVTVKAQD